MILVICGPSGGGKTTQVDKLLARTSFKRAITVTTRDMRPGEINGVHYHFVSKDIFELWKAGGMFVETAKKYGNYYGLLVQTVLDARKSKSDLILNIDVQGLRSVRNHSDRILTETVKAIFLMPPTMEDLEIRLRGRKDTTEAQIQKRLAEAPAEMALSLEIGFFDGIILTYNKEYTYQKITEFISHYS